MIVFPRSMARSFRALVRKCVSGRPRGPAPNVVCEIKDRTLSLWAKTDDAVLVYSAPSTCNDIIAVVSMAVLDAVEGSSHELVEISIASKLKGEARFTDRGVPCVHTFDAILPDTNAPEAPALSSRVLQLASYDIGGQKPERPQVRDPPAAVS